MSIYYKNTLRTLTHTHTHTHTHRQLRLKDECSCQRCCLIQHEGWRETTLFPSAASLHSSPHPSAGGMSPAPVTGETHSITPSSLSPQSTLHNPRTTPVN